MEEETYSRPIRVRIFTCREVDDLIRANPPEPHVDYLCVADLLRRDWTPSVIRYLLGEPDALAVSTVCYNFPLVKLYRKNRVVAMEREPEFNKSVKKLITQRRKSLMESIEQSVDIARKGNEKD